MDLPLAAGHVLVRLSDGPPQSAEAVLDALERAFPTHAGRGRTRRANPWEDPPTSAPAASGWSEVFDRTSGPARLPPLLLPGGGLTVELLGTPADAEAMARALAGLGATRRTGHEQQGPHLAVRLRLGA
ncbi:hypothetical protein [Kitasatospora sp. MMS16-BH015]|uniref:hypothetical protein n=1 Tax=Kitasatospora sp. MMS16-BH015 TaxID=2018025 RepID=UPI000CF2296F|nr:hypothetical protein [Kitasatospora sp. MMS16-BH015]